MPTLLAVSGVAANPAFLPGGANLLPILSGSPPVQEQSLSWGYKAHAQRAARIGDYKFLKPRQNTFLFNVVETVEQPNLRNRMPKLYARMEAEWLR